MPSGNSNDRETLTGASNIIFVSGTQENGARWDDGSGQPGSTWGPLVDLAAPAKDILVADGPDGYPLMEGTSFSSAIAAGAAALVWSANPNLTPDQVQSILYGTATDLGTAGWDEVYGNGLLNVGAAVEEAQAMAMPEPATLALLAFGGVVTLVSRRRRKAP
jgi:subtilisin family serine protease